VPLHCGRERHRANFPSAEFRIVGINAKYSARRRARTSTKLALNANVTSLNRKAGLPAPNLRLHEILFGQGNPDQQGI
jgi:hypothetical protein